MYVVYGAYSVGVDEEIPVTEARAQLSELINRVGYGKERIVLTRHGKPLVALVPAEVLAEVDSRAESSPTVLDISAQATDHGPARLSVAAHDPYAPSSKAGPNVELS